MTLEFEKLTGDIEQMVQLAVARRDQDSERLELLLQRLLEYSTRWDAIHEAVDRALALLNPIWYHSALPLTGNEPLNHPIDPCPTPEKATIIACDGSQIIPDRHSPFLYSLINLGIIVYFHGSGCAPLQETYPTLRYPTSKEDEIFEDSFAISSTTVNLRRDLAEIQTLVEEAASHSSRSNPVLALLDQRLLYWAMGASENSEVRRVLHGWQDAMSLAHEKRVLLTGYIVRPGTRSVVTMLHTLGILEEQDFDVETLQVHKRNHDITDATLFRQLLKPGQRSAVFVDVSQHNTEFAGRDKNNEVCFFYLNPGQRGRQIARVDIPRWVAEDPQKVEAVHGLIYSQCQIMGDYPYVLARADEMAVVGYRDRESLEIMIENAMERYGLAGSVTAKQSSKSVARAARTRHEM